MTMSTHPPCPAWVQRTSKATTPLPTLGGNVHHHLHPSISPSPTDLATYLPTYLRRLPPSTDLHRSEPSNHSTDPTLSTSPSLFPRGSTYALHHVHPLRPSMYIYIYIRMYVYVYIYIAGEYTKMGGTVVDIAVDTDRLDIDTDLHALYICVYIYVCAQRVQYG